MKFAAISTLGLATLAAATTTVTVTAPAPGPTAPPASQCNTGHVYCCNTSQLGPSNSNWIVGLLTIIGVVVEPITAIVGSSCSPISVVGVGSGAQCNQSPVCCQNNNYHVTFGVVIGCSPVNINL